MIRRYFPTLALAVLALAFVVRVVGLEKPSRYLFDEDFFAFTAHLMITNDQRAYQWWHGPLTTEVSQYTYRAPAVEWLHPPVSKLVQAGSIAVLGNMPLAWRLPSAIAGVFVVLLLMQLTKTMFDSSLAALMIGIIASFEQLLVTQSRIASPDIFVVLFVLLTLASYWSYHQHRKITSLIITGVCLGLAIATKWTAAFLLPGLMMYELWYWLQTKSKKITLYALKSWSVFCLTICGVASVVYLSSFTQFFIQGHTVSEFIELHQQIWQYQTTATFEHAGSSRPWQWLIGDKPILYYVDESSQISTSTITAQPTKSVLLFAEGATLIALVMLIHHRKKLNQQWRPTLLLITVVFSLYLPFWLIARPLFIYHFAPILTVFLVIAGGQLARVIPDPKT